MKTIHGWNASDELVAFKKDFENKTGIIVDIAENRQYFHWKRLIFKKKLNCDDLEIISNYIKNTFMEKGRYTHLLPSITSWENYLVLTVDVEEIENFIMKK